MQSEKERVGVPPDSPGTLLHLIKDTGDISMKRQMWLILCTVVVLAGFSIAAQTTNAQTAEAGPSCGTEPVVLMMKRCPSRETSNWKSLIAPY